MIRGSRHLRFLCSNGRVGRLKWLVLTLLFFLVQVSYLPENRLGATSPPRGKVMTSRDSLNTVILYFAGDCTLADHFEVFVGDRLDYPFQRLTLLPRPDIFMVNLENPVTSRTQRIEKEFNFKMNPKYLMVLQSAGINVVTLANNHIFDYGSEGLLDTIHYLDSLSIRHVGAGHNLTEARKPTVFEVKGFRIAFLGYFGGGAFSAGARQPGVAPRYEAAVRRDIQVLRQIDKVD
jgi:hypothetical protein